LDQNFRNKIFLNFRKFFYYFFLSTVFTNNLFSFSKIIVIDSPSRHKYNRKCSMIFVLPSVDNNAGVHHYRLYNNRVTSRGTVKFNFETMFLVGFNGFGGKIKDSLSVQQIEIWVRIMKGPDSGGGLVLMLQMEYPSPYLHLYILWMFPLLVYQ